MNIYSDICTSLQMLIRYYKARLFKLAVNICKFVLLALPAIGVSVSLSVHASNTELPSWESLIAPERATARLVNLHSLIAAEAKRGGIKPQYLAVIVALESGPYPNPCVVGADGEQGITQVLPSTARSMGYFDLFNPRDALRAGAQYFAALYKRANGDAIKAYAAYNGGPRIFTAELRPITKQHVARAQVLLEKAERDGWVSLISGQYVRNANRAYCTSAWVENSLSGKLLILNALS